MKLRWLADLLCPRFPIPRVRDANSPQTPSPVVRPVPKDRKRARGFALRAVSQCLAPATPLSATRLVVTLVSSNANQWTWLHAVSSNIYEVNGSAKVSTVSQPYLVSRQLMRWEAALAVDRSMQSKCPRRNDRAAPRSRPMRNPAASQRASWRSGSCGVGTCAAKAEPIEGEHVFAFLLCGSNVVVAPAHPRAMASFWPGPKMRCMACGPDRCGFAPVTHHIRFDALHSRQREKHDPANGFAAKRVSCSEAGPEAARAGRSQGCNLFRHGLSLKGSPCTSSTRVGRAPQC